MPYIIAIVAIVVLLLIYVFSTYNSLVGLRNKVRDEWSQIDIQLKRRFDLIPNVVETVKGYAKHEKDTFEDVVKARNTFNSATTKEDEMKASNELTKSVSKLFALAESYPELKSNTNFLDLQAQLKETEDKISYARGFYNDIVLKYNDKVMKIPSNIVAKMFGFKEETYFEALKEERENVKVSF